jgi:hypothetical protein
VHPVELYLVWRKDSDNAIMSQFLDLVRSSGTQALLA